MTLMLWAQAVAPAAEFLSLGALVGVGCLAVGWRIGGLLSRWPLASATTFGVALIAMGWALRRGGMMDPSHLDAAAILISLAGGWFFGITEAPTRAIARGVAGATAALVLTGLSLTRSGAAAEVSQRGNLASALARVANPSLPPPPRAVDPTHGEP